MNDQTNPRRTTPHGAGEEAAPNDRTNPSAAAKPRAGRRRASSDRTNPRAPANSATAEPSAPADQTDPKPAANPGAPPRAAVGDRTPPKIPPQPPAAKRLAPGRTNPSPGAKAARVKGAARKDRSDRSSAAKRSATDERTNLRRAADRAATARHGLDDRTNPSGAAAAAAAAQRGLDNRTNPRQAAPGRLYYDDAYIRGILQRVKTIAAVGMSANDMRPSYFAMLYLQQKGYRMIPVNPRYAGEEILGETVVATLGDLPAPPDMVQIFRRSEEAPAVVDEAIRAGAKVVWLQLGIRSDEAAAKARAAGLDVVMDRCPKIEYGRLFGEIGWAGVNRRVISAKKGQALQLSHAKGGLGRRPPPRR